MRLLERAGSQLRPAQFLYGSHLSRVGSRCSWSRSSPARSDSVVSSRALAFAAAVGLA